MSVYVLSKGGVGAVPDSHGMCPDGRAGIFAYSVNELRARLGFPSGASYDPGFLMDGITRVIDRALADVGCSGVSTRRTPRLQLSGDAKYMTIEGVSFCPIPGEEDRFPNTNQGEPFSQIFERATGGGHMKAYEFCPTEYVTMRPPSSTSTSRPIEAGMVGTGLLAVGAVVGLGYLIFGKKRH